MAIRLCRGKPDAFVFSEIKRIELPKDELCVGWPYYSLKYRRCENNKVIRIEPLLSFHFWHSLPALSLKERQSRLIML